MKIVLPALGVALAALCVWLAVRIVNRRERWAKWILFGLIVVLAYPLSFGPACWLGRNCFVSARVVTLVYRPIVAVMGEGPEPIRRAIRSYAGFQDGGFDSVVFELELTMERLCDLQ